MEARSLLPFVQTELFLVSGFVQVTALPLVKFG